MTATGDDAAMPADPTGPEGDYSYDLVHDEVPEAYRAEQAAGPAPRPAEDEPVAEAGGDYSYDLAHEVPPSRPR